MHLLCCSLNNSLHFASLKDLNIGTESDGEIGIVAANYTVAVYLHNAVRILHIERVVINLESKLVKIWNCIGTNEHIRIKYIYTWNSILRLHKCYSSMWTKTRITMCWFCDFLFVSFSADILRLSMVVNKSHWILYYYVYFIVCEIISLKCMSWYCAGLKV